MTHENYKSSAPGRARILACAIGHAKMVAASESCEIAQTAFLGQITSFESGCARNFLKERSREGRDIRVRDWAREKGCRLEIARIAQVAY